MRTIFLLVGSAPVAFLLSNVWWRLWMYHGLMGPPALLKPFIRTDGEGSYDRVGLEMFIVLWLLMAVGLLLWACAHRRRGSEPLVGANGSPGE